MSKLTVIEGSFGKQTNTEEDAAHTATIKFLEDTLQKARDERAVFAQVMLLLPDNSVLSGWSDKGRCRPFVVIGALEDIKMQFHAKNVEQR